MIWVRFRCLVCLIACASVLPAAWATCPGAAWTIEGDDMNQSLGRIVTGLGDVNGDGFADVMVAVPGKGSGFPVPHFGEIQVYLGSPSGIGGSPSQVLVNNVFPLGNSASAAGDTNADGYDDLIIGTSDSAGTGVALVYLGSSSGLSDTPAWMAVGPTDAGPNEGFGKTVSSAGDVNGDGFDDVLVGDPDANNGDVVGGGRVYLFLGSLTGPSNQPHQILRGLFPSGYFGWGANTAGDTNADGFDDVIISQPGFVGAEGFIGRALVLLGSATGLGEEPVWVTDLDEGYGVSAVGTAGDVNGDGYADIIVGQRTYPPQGLGRQDSGRAVVYLGSTNGPAANPSWIVNGKHRSYLGDQAVTVGDFNGDGFSDIAVSAPSPSDTSKGRVFVYLGGGAGLENKPVLVVATTEPYGYFGASLSSTGDTDGDGRADLILGDPSHDNATYTILDLGQACIYRLP